MESILNAPPRRPIPVPQPSTGCLRAAIILVVVGLAASALGGMMCAIATSSAAQGSGNEAGVLVSGVAILSSGAVLFLCGLLAEFFAIGTSLHSIAISSEATLSLLRSRPAAQPESEAQNSQPSMFPPRVA